MSEFYTFVPFSFPFPVSTRIKNAFRDSGPEFLGLPIRVNGEQTYHLSVEDILIVLLSGVLCRTPNLGKTSIKQLADACHKELLKMNGIKVVGENHV